MNASLICPTKRPEFISKMSVNYSLYSYNVKCCPAFVLTGASYVIHMLQLTNQYFIQFVACQTLLRADEIELLTSKGVFQVDSDQSNPKIATTMNYPDMVSLVTDQFRGDMQTLKAEETLEGIRANCTSFKDQMVSLFIYYYYHH